MFERIRKTIGDSIAVKEAVAEKTGYPPEMLELDMNLDSDLGIDSIKRVEILSAFQEKRPDAPAVTPEDMGSIHTLRDIVDFLARRGGQAAAASPTPARRSGRAALSANARRPRPDPPVRLLARPASHR